MISLIFSFIKDYVNDYNIFDTEDHPAIVTEKFTTKSLTGMPKYYVTVDLNDADFLSGIQNRVFSWQFKRLEAGDSIKGYYIRGEHFYTALDVLTDSSIFLLALTIPILVLLGLLCWPIIAILDRKENKKKKPYSHQKRNKRKVIRHHQLEEEPSLLERILPKLLHPHLSKIKWFAAIFAVLMLTNHFIVNGVGKILPFGKTATEGIVIDKEFTSGIRQNTIITLSIKFIDHSQEEIAVIRDVTKPVYDEHAIGDSINISYHDHNPYHVYIRDNHFRHHIAIIFSARFLFPMFLLVGLLIIILLKMRRRYRKV